MWPILVGTFCHDLFLHVPVEKFVPTEDSWQKWHRGCASEVLFTLEHPIGYSILLYGCSHSRKQLLISLFVTTCLEVQNNLKKALIQEDVLLMCCLKFFGFIMVFLYKKGPNFEVDCLNYF